jgi:hypothetical protein
MYCKVERIGKEVAVVYLNTTGIVRFFSVGSGQNNAIYSRHVARNLGNLTREKKSALQDLRLSELLF